MNRLHILRPAAVVLLAGTGLGAALPTTQQALTLAFPGAEWTRKEHWLTEPQGQQVQALSGTALAGLWQVSYEARSGGQLLGVAYLDTHRVRTLPETTLVVVTADGRIQRVEVLAFREPQEYLAKEAWVRQFDGKGLDAQLSLKGAIRPLSGSTLTAHALTDAARRMLALHQVLHGEGK